MNKLYLVAIFLLACISIQGQVTIGSSEVPNNGALLDLKERNNPVGEEGKENASKGLGLPRVKLIDRNKLTMGTNVIADAPITGGGTVWESHTGLLVYNINEDVCDPKIPAVGLNVWDGAKWMSLSDTGINDLSGLRTATPDETSGANIWGTDVVLHQAKTGVYEKFTSADFGSAGRWMTTNLSAKAYDGIQHSQHPTRTLQQHDGRTTNDYNVAFWTYPGDNHTIIAGESATPEYAANPRLGLLYTWDAATAGKGGNTGQKNINNTSGGENPNNESGFLEGTGANQQIRIQGICPAGWHLPSDAEFTDLENYIKNHTKDHSSMDNIGGADTPYGNATPSNIAIGTAMKNACENGTNASNPISERGFNWLLAGSASLGSTGHYGDDGYLWSSSSNISSNAWYRCVGSGGTYVLRSSNFRNYLFSVRCKKD